MNYVSFYQNRLLGYDFLQNIFYERPFKGVTKPTYKVGILIDSAFKFPPLTGITYRLYQLSNVLINHGHEVCWFICNRNFKSIEEIQSLGSSQIKIHLIPEDYFYDLTYMSAILLHEKIDILQYEISQTFFSIGMELKRRTNIPCVLENHDIEFDLQRTLDGSSDTDLLKFTQGLACQVADAVVCMTQTDQQLLINELRIDPRKIILAPNGIQTTYESPKFEDKDDILVFLGNFFYKPNLESLEFFMDQVFPDLVVACPNVHVRALGMMPEETRQKYNLVKNFVATGPLTEEQLLTELNHAKVGMCTVLSGSGMKVKILTYSANGLPIITTTIGASGYEKISSLIITDGTAQDILNHTIMLLENSDLAEQVGQSNLCDVRKHFLWDQIALKMKEAYDMAFSTIHTSYKELLPPKPRWLSEKRHEKIEFNQHVVLHNNHLIQVRP